MVRLLEGIDGDFGTGREERHVTAEGRVHRQVVVFVEAAACLDDGQMLVAGVKNHLRVTSELGTLWENWEKKNEINQ